MKPKFDYTKCDKPVKEMFHGVCLHKCTKCGYVTAI